MEENKVEDKTEKTFKERYLAGEIEFEEIDRYISRWNNSDDPRTLAQYLGLNAEEEDVWCPFHPAGWTGHRHQRSHRPG